MHPDKRTFLILFLSLAIISGSLLVWRFDLIPQGYFDFSRGSASTGSSAGLSMTQCGSSICGNSGGISVPLAEFQEYGAPCVTADYFRYIGDFTGDGADEAYFLYCNGSGGRTLFIVDFNAQKIIGRSTVPTAFSSFSAFVGSTKDPESKLHPYIANGYGDDGSWGYVCAYRPDIINKYSDDTCGEGFVRIRTKPLKLPSQFPSIFREVGGYSQDLDHDGWEDINLIYHYGIVTVSPRTLATLTETYYDVASSDEPSSPVGFHSGRNYGLHTSFSYNNKQYNLILGGVPVGTYHSNPTQGTSDAMCNVSRFVSLLEGDVASRRLLWSDYHGFHSHTFQSYEAGTIHRYGDFQNGCIHYFNTQIFDINGRRVIAYNVFRESTPIDQCIPEQQEFYSGNTDSWNACFPQNMQSAGRWSFVIKDLLTGADLVTHPNYYVLGSENLLSGTATEFAAIKLPTTTKYPFDLDGVSNKQYVAFALTNTFQIESETSIPADALPTLNYTDDRPRDAVGYGSLNNGLPKLMLPSGKYPLATAQTTTSVTPKIGDLNGDTIVNIIDYTTLLGKFGATANLGSADIIPDGKVDIYDYNALVLNIGK